MAEPQAEQQASHLPAEVVCARLAEVAVLHAEVACARPEVAQQAHALASGMMTLGLLPEREAEGKKWRFAAIQAKNRTEWTVTHLANMHVKTTTIGLYDSLGDTETRYIVAQTELATIFCSN